jgi:hypothetical protein
MSNSGCFNLYLPPFQNHLRFDVAGAYSCWGVMEGEMGLRTGGLKFKIREVASTRGRHVDNAEGTIRDNRMTRKEEGSIAVTWCSS